MKNSNLPAFSCDPKIDVEGNSFRQGLSKREYIASQALVGMISLAHGHPHFWKNNTELFHN